MKLDPALLDHFHQLNAALAEIAAFCRLQAQIENSLAEKISDEKDDRTNSSCSD